LEERERIKVWDDKIPDPKKWEQLLEPDRIAQSGCPLTVGSRDPLYGFFKNPCFPLLPNIEGFGGGVGVGNFF